MTTTRGTAGRNAIIVLGQSLNNQPLGPSSFQRQLAQRFSGTPLVDCSLAGIAWLQWARTDWQAHYIKYATRARRVIYAQCGGTTDYGTTGNRTGAQVYADETTVSTAMRTAGGTPRVKVIGSTTHPSFAFGMNTTVAAGSDNVDVGNDATFVFGTGVLNVVNSVNALGGTVKVQTTNGTATISYTGSAGNQLTGCHNTSGVSQVVHTGYTCRDTQCQNWLDGNVLVAADASTAFDAMIDYAADSHLSDPFNTTYYQSDGTHETAAGAAVMVSLIAPVIEGMML